MKITIRELEDQDIDGIINYWTSASEFHLRGMGADPAKLPSEDAFREMLVSNIQVSYPEKTSYCLIWVLNDKAIGHSNINQIRYAQEATMHLHLWDAGLRQKGLGARFLRLCIPEFFSNYKLQKLICEPYADNSAPNKTLQKLGFTFIKKYRTIPGSINFEQEVNQWALTSVEDLQ